jgi:hypothetical protein
VVWIDQKLRSERLLAGLRERFPYVSLDGRLPVREPRQVEPPVASAENIEWLEKRIEDSMAATRGTAIRVHSLRRLHEQTLQVFASRPAFGAARMRSFDWYLGQEMRREPPLAQPGTRITFAWSSGDLEAGADGKKPQATSRGPSTRRSCPAPIWWSTSACPDQTPAGPSSLPASRHWPPPRATIRLVALGRPFFKIAINRSQEDLGIMSVVNREVGLVAHLLDKKRGEPVGKLAAWLPGQFTVALEE